MTNSSPQKGDILIAYSVDIEWEPYLYLLSGLVVERSLGSGLSELAEAVLTLGLPCLVAIGDVTNYFHTGEMACIDGRHATLRRLGRDVGRRSKIKNQISKPTKDKEIAELQVDNLRANYRRPGNSEEDASGDDSVFL